MGVALVTQKPEQAKRSNKQQKTPFRPVLVLPDAPLVHNRTSARSIVMDSGTGASSYSAFVPVPPRAIAWLRSLQPACWLEHSKNVTQLVVVTPLSKRQFVVVETPARFWLIFLFDSASLQTRGER